MKRLTSILTTMAISLFVSDIQAFEESDVSGNKPKPPENVYKLKGSEGSLTRLPDGNLMLFKLEDANLYSMISTDGAHSWSEPKLEIKNVIGGAGMVLVDHEGEIHGITEAYRKVAPSPGGLKGPGATLLLDLWHKKTINNRTAWEESKMVFDGYCGSLLDFKQLRNGRLIAPFAYWVAGRSPLPIGQNISTVIYSDDVGDSWTLADVKLTAPTYAGYPGSNYGAIEPSLIELQKDGHLYMLLRANTGFLYESSSTDNGSSWSKARASRFYTYNGPALLKELPNHRFFLAWNNCDNPPKHKGKGVYGSRDAIHAAISDDYGKTWKGFREIHRDPLRNQTPPKWGDRGTSYANSAIGIDGKIMLVTGMGEGRRHIVSVDPEWLTAKHHESDFSKGLEEWLVFKHFGPADRWWQDRTVGPELIDHPSRKGVKVLHLRRPDEKDADGAVWNFPNGRSGKLRLKLMLNEGFGGGSIALTDRCFNPTDNHGERLAMFTLPISAEGRLASGPKISIGKWHTLDLVWELEAGTCKVYREGKELLRLPQQHETLNGLSYLRLRSKAPVIDNAGYLVESVVVDIDDNVAPPVNKENLLAFEAEYREKLSYDELLDESSETDFSDDRGKITTNGLWIHNKTTELEGMKLGPFVKLTDEGILTVEENTCFVSYDQGQLWEQYPIFSEPDTYQIRPERALLQTKNGAIILAFMNELESANWNWQEDISDSPGAILPTYAVRSLDGGKTWEPPQKLHDDWTGAIRDMIETRDGSVVFTTMMMRHNPGRHTVVTYTSKDNGKSWIRSNIIDKGGIGHHAGVTEATLEQLKDGRLWLLMRTNWKTFWEAYSDDEGLNWKGIKPTSINASSAPGLLKRLKSGRLVLVWNRYFPEGKKEYPLRGGDNQWSEVPVSNHRDELSIMFSNDDGKSWSQPVVIARKGKQGQVSYPYVFEAEPGVLWITSWFGELRIKLYEKDFIDDERTDYVAKNTQ